MTRKGIGIVAAKQVDGGDDFVAEARVRHKESFPGRSARRMTHLGMLLDLCIRDFDIDEHTPLVYASAFAESRSLEDFIDSFPHASPAGFQTSIHPSAVEQSLIMRKRPVHRFFPITSSRNLAGLALETALLLEDERVLVAGGEEKGEWLTPFQLASDRSFAFSLELAESAENVCGQVALDQGVNASQVSEVGLWELYQSIKDRTPLRVPSYALNGVIELSWK